MKFEWDKRKSIANLKKHGLDFETAALIFNDPHIVSSIDARFNYEEERWQSLGAIEDAIVFIIYIVKEYENEEEIIRIISARKATSSEARRYYAHRQSA